MEKNIISEEELKIGTLPVNKIIHGDCLKILRKFPNNSIDCVITSPPYWAKRDYGEEVKSVFGGNPNCQHEWEPLEVWQDNLRFRPGHNSQVGKDMNPKVFSNPSIEWLICKKCGAQYGQLGLEPTPEMFVDHLILIFREIKRILKPSGNLFVVIDDTYSGSGWSQRNNDPKNPTRSGEIYSKLFKNKAPRKSLSLVPELFAIKMVYEEGWILRNKIIWAKKVHIYKKRTTIGLAMPESVKDRLTHTWEYIYHFVKKPKYWYDLNSARIPHKESSKERAKYPIAVFGGNPNQPLAKLTKGKKGGSKTKKIELNPIGANPGDVLQTNIQPFRDAHFAVFPESLVEFLIKIGCPEKVCKKCGKPDCNCNVGWESGIVLDPFLGSGTTALVALRMGRRFIGIELNHEYCLMALKRIKPFLKQEKITFFLF